MKFVNKAQIKNVFFLVEKIISSLLIFKYNSFILLFLIIASTFAEAFSIALIFPLIESFQEKETSNTFDIFFKYLNFNFNSFTIILFFVSIFILKNILLISRFFFEEYLTSRVIQFYTDKITKLIYNTKSNNLNKYKIGNFNAFVTVEIRNIGNCLRVFLNVVSSLILLLFLFLVFIFYNPGYQSIYVILIIILIFALLRPLSIYVKNLGKKRVQFLENYSGLFSDYLLNYKQIKLFTLENIALLNLRKNASKNIQINRLLKFYSTLPRPIIEVIFIILLVFFFLVYSFLRDSNFNEMLPIITLFVVIGYRFLTQLNVIVRSIYTFANYYGSFWKLHEIQSNLLVTNNVNPKNKDYVKCNGDIHFKNLCFNYEKKLVFDHLNISIKSNSRTLIKGNSGTGKSTLIDLLVKFQTPNSGNITIDNTNLKNINTTYLRNKVGYVSQDVLLFNDSIINNIKLVKPNISDKEFDKLSAITFCNEFIKDIPQNKDFVVGERGLNLSGGQRQRLGILRALVKNPDIIILDESLNAIDEKMSLLILKNIFSEYRNSTVIVISHSSFQSNNFDTIINLDDLKLNG